MPPSQNPCYGSTNRAAHVYSTPLIRSSSIEATEDCLRSSPPALPSSFEIILQRKELQTFSYLSQIFRETSPKSISYTFSLPSLNNMHQPFLQIREESKLAPSLWSNKDREKKKRQDEGYDTFRTKKDKKSKREDSENKDQHIIYSRHPTRFENS